VSIPQAQLSMTKLTAGNIGGSAGVRLEITNWNDIMKVLNKLDKDYVKELRTSFKEIAKPVQDRIKKNIPSKGNPPLSQMRQVHFGRLAWGTTYGGGGTRPKPAKSVLVQLPSTRSAKARRSGAISIARLQVGSPGTVLFDMAGRKNYSKARRGFTPTYDYMYTINGQKVPGKRKHKVTPMAFAKGLGQAKSRLNINASRIVWPAAEQALPEARKKMDGKITEVNRKVSELLRSK
jgi:hypothetical protein